MAEEQLIIEVKYDDHGAKQKVDSLTKSFEALNTVTSGKGFTQLNNVAKSLESLGQSLSGISGAGSSLREVARSASALSTAFKSFDGKSVRGLNRIATALNSIKIQNKSLESVSKLANGLSRLKNAAKDPDLAQNLKNTAKQITAFAQDITSGISDDVLSRFERIGTAMAGISSRMTSMNAGVLSGASGSAKGSANLFSGITSGAKKAVSALSSMGKMIAHTAAQVVKTEMQIGKLPFMMILRPFQAIGKGISDMTSKFQGFLTGIGRIALYRAIRTGIKLVTSAVREGVSNLYEWAGIVGNSFKPTMDSLATSFNYLKNSIGAAVSPLLDWVAPIVDSIIDKFVSVINVFNQLIATLTGASTWRKATKQAVTYGDAADKAAKGTKDANKAAKELRRTLLGFDEINRLDDEKNSSKTPSTGSGTGSGGSNVNGLTFTEQDISQSVKDLAKKIKDAWAKGDFTDIGSDIASKIADGLNSIDWDKKVKPAVKKLATSAGTLINGMFDYNGSEGGKKLWDAIARTIYNGINTAILGYVTFFNTVKWDGIGAGIGAALKKVLGKINWTAKSGEASVSQALAAFPNAVIDAFTGFSTQFKKKDFEKLGSNLGKTISEALTLIKWKDLFDNTLTIGTNLLAGLNSFLTSFDWKGVKDGIVGGLKKVKKKTWNDLGTEIGNLIANTGNFVLNLIDTVGSLISAGKWKTIAKGIGKSLHDKIKGYDWNKGSNKLSDALVSLPNAVIDAISGLLDDLTADDFKKVGDFIGSTVGKALAKIKWDGLFGNAVTLVSNLVSGINGAFEGLSTQWSKIKNGILRGIRKIPRTTWSSLGEGIGRIVFNVLTFGARLAELLIEALGKIKWGDLLSGFKKGIQKSVQAAGGWKKISEGIADFLVKNLGTISVLLSFLLAKPILKGAIKGMFGHALASNLGGTYSETGTGGGMIKGIRIGALVSLGVDIASNIVGGKGAKKDEETTPEGVFGKLASYTGKGAIAGSFAGPLGALFGGLASGFAGMTSEAYAKDAFSPENNRKWNETVDEAWTNIGNALGRDYKGTGKFEKKNDVVEESNGVLGWLGRLLGGTTANAAQPENVGLATNLKPPKGASELYTPNGKQYKIDLKGNIVEVSSKKLKTKQKTISGMVGSIGSTIQKKLNLKKNPLTGMQAIISKVEESLEPGSKTSSGWLAKYTKDPEGDGIKGKEVTGFTANYAEKTGAAIKPFTLLDNSVEYKNRFGEAIEKKFTLTGNTAQYDKRTGTAQAAFTVDGNVAQYDKRTGAGQKAFTLTGNTAQYDSKSGAGQKAFTLKGNVAQYDSKSGAGQKAFTLKGNTAQYDKRTNGGGLTPTTISDWTAKFTKRETVEKNLKTTVPGWLAKFTGKDSGWSKEKSLTGTRSGWIAKFTGKDSAWKKEKSLTGTKSGWKAEFTKKDGSSSKLVGSKSGWTAEFTKKDASSKNLKGTTSGWTAKFTKVKEDINKSDKKVTGFTAIISALKAATKTIGSKLGIPVKATGGVYKNGKWYPVTQFAAGGLPMSGQMFIAREAGPELVGTIGGNTAVLNNDQIVASVAAGVGQAVAAAMGGGNAPTIEVTIKADPETLYRTVKRGERMANNRYGTAVAMG